MKLKYARKGLVFLARTLAPAFAADLSLDETLAICRKSASKNMATAICYWNNKTDTPQSIANECLAAIAALPAIGSDTYLSVKAPPLGYSRVLAGAIATEASRLSIPLHFDSHAPDAADPTFELIEFLSKTHASIGCTLPGRWRRSLADADRAVEQGLSVRVVKGQWAEAPQNSIDPAEGFLALVDRLAGRSTRVRIATHDKSIAKEALLRLTNAGTPCELELLLGLSNRTSADVAAELGVPVRYYIPFGHGWLPFVLDKVREDPRLALRTVLPTLRDPVLPWKLRTNS